MLSPQDESRFEAVTHPYYEQLNGYIGYYFYTGSYLEKDAPEDQTIFDVLGAHEKTIIHIPNVNSRESTKDKIKEVENILHGLANGRALIQKRAFTL